MLIDDITIKVSAGRGGDGAVAFTKNKMSLGPSGASGGRGGHRLNDGATGKDITLKIPVGTVIHNKTLDKDYEITKIGEKLLMAKGGHGGKGNFLFRSSHNTSPKQFQRGLSGQSYTLRLELKLIADVGLIGLPNVGKSSLLNELTNAKSRVANYPFTTLEPNLGSYYELILADIPGLIEGASRGRGLGIKFLRHIERTRVLFHLISVESENPLRDYKAIRVELKNYSEVLLGKKEYAFLSKSDLISTAELKKKIGVLKKSKIAALPISIHDWESIKMVEKILNKIIKDKKA